MSREELMKPRYRVISDWPQSNINPFHVGDILVKNGIHFTRIDNPKSLHENEIALYPHLFQKLEWWEERQLDEMPEYVKDAFIPVTSEYHKVFKAKYDISHNTLFLDNCPLTFYGKIRQLLPATEEEYNAFLTTTR